MKPLAPHSPLGLRRRALALAFFVTATAMSYGQVSPQVSGQIPPESVPTLGRVLWLRADRGVTSGHLSDLVEDWSDVQAPFYGSTCWDSSMRPEWRAAEVNGRPALHFDGNDWLLGYWNPTESFTKVVVCQLDQLDTNNDVCSNFSAHEICFGGSDRARLFHGAELVTSKVGVNVATPIVLVATYDAASGRAVLYQDGFPAGAGADGSENSEDSAILLGSFSSGSSFSGSIAEVLAYDRVLNAIELRKLHAYLLRRYHYDPPPGLQWTLLPRPGQLWQRDGNDSAAVQLAGSVTSTGWSAFALVITRDGLLYDSSQQALNFVQGSAPFSFTRTLIAGKYDYELSLYALRGSERRLLARVGNLAVGDVWLINGQSNAMASDGYGEQLANAEDQSDWVRSFGTASDGSGGPFDLHWDRAEGEQWYSHCAVGAWGLRLGALLEQRYGMPIGLINGAEAGTPIAAHLRDDAHPLNLLTIYGRLLYRAEAAGVRDAVRGMLWYQGESDGNADLWKTSWQQLKQSWQLDYPGLQQIYLFQIRDDCAGGGQLVREAQRELIDNSTDTYVMSTTAAPQHNGCHFHFQGYRELGDRLARVLGRDVYGSTDTQEIDPPNIGHAAWNGTSHTQILLTFRDPDDRLVFDPGAEADFFTNDGVAVLSGTVSGNTVLLQLAGPSQATTISYNGHPGDGPWLKNAREVGALTFFGVAIE